MQAGGRRFDPDWLHQVPFGTLSEAKHDGMTAHTLLIYAIGAAACGVFFDNVDVASVLDEFICRNVS